MLLRTIAPGHGVKAYRFIQLSAFSTSRPSWRLNRDPPPFNTASSFSITEPPHPQWRIGDGMLEETTLGKSWKWDAYQGWITWDTKTTPEKQLYGLLTSAIIPRPIAFVSTMSADGVANLAPMSYFNLVSHNPPLLSISFSLSLEKPKDTRENILATKQFTVNIVSEPFIEAAHFCSVEAPPEIDEWIVSGLTPEPSLSVKPARVRESAINLECELYKSIDITNRREEPPTITLVLGLIKHIHIRKAVLHEKKDLVDPSKLRPVARLGGRTYARLGKGFDIARPAWTAVKQCAEEKMRERSSLVSERDGVSRGNGGS